MRRPMARLSQTRPRFILRRGHGAPFNRDGAPAIQLDARKHGPASVGGAPSVSAVENARLRLG
jgi:hypothetical protein